MRLRVIWGCLRVILNVLRVTFWLIFKHVIFNVLILKNKKYLAREDNPLTRITRTVLYIYTKNCIQEDRNSCNPLLMELSAPSNFTPAKLKNALRWWAFPPLVETWHHIHQLDNG